MATPTKQSQLQGRTMPSPCPRSRPRLLPARRSVLAAGFVPPEETLYASFADAVARYGPRPCLGRRVGDEYKYLTYSVGVNAFLCFSASVAALSWSLLGARATVSHACLGFSCRLPRVCCMSGAYLPAQFQRNAR